MRRKFGIGDAVAWALAAIAPVWAVAPMGIDLGGFGKAGVAGTNRPGSILDAFKSNQKVLQEIPNTTFAQTVKNLPVRQGRPAERYNRRKFGQRWADEDRNGCDTRNDILARDMRQVTYKPGTRNCVVLSGVLQDPYTGKVINFVRGNRTPEAVQIDHVVALADAWASGADKWDGPRRQKFANDPLNLLAVDGPANQAKSAYAADRWLPPDADYRCAYVARQVRIKQVWGLTVTADEQRTMALTASECPSQQLPAGPTLALAH